MNNAQIVGGNVNFAIRDSTNANDNLLVSNAGNVTVRNNLTVSGSTVTLPTGSIGIGAIANISRTVSIPLLSFTASAAYICPPTLTDVAAGASLGITLRITSGGTADDAVNFQAVEFRYTATE